MKTIYNFDEFVAPRLKDKAVWLRNSYVSFPGWLNLYVRVTSRYLNGEERGMVIDLANIEARAKGKGTFKKLIAHIRKTYPGTVIHVEEVQSERSARVFLGWDSFRARTIRPASSFYQKPHDHHRSTQSI